MDSEPTRKENIKVEKILGYLLLGLVLGIIISGTRVDKI
jgi:hypothetical protein